MSEDLVRGSRDYYFATLGLSGKRNSREQRKAALDRAYAMRTFEIDLYWRRALYFWGFQTAIFAAVGLTWKSSSDSNTPDAIPPALAVLGVLVAIAHYLLASGSTFWQRNWESHIDWLEDEFEGALYKTVWLSDGKRSRSPSQLNQTLLAMFVMFWFFCLLVSTPIWNWVSGYILDSSSGWNTFPAWSLSYLVAVLVGWTWLSLQFTRFKRARNAVPWNDDQNFVDWCRLRARPSNGGSDTTMILRDTPSPKSL